MLRINYFPQRHYEHKGFVYLFPSPAIINSVYLTITFLKNTPIRYFITSIFLLLLLFPSCHSKKEKNADIIIEGNVSGLPDGKLYLVEAKKWKTPLDSAECKDGRFEFRIQADSSFMPYLAAIHYWKEEDTIRPVRLQFANHVLNESPGLLRDVFYLEKGTTTISSGQDNNAGIRIKAGNETELLYRYQLNDIGWMGDADTALRKHKLLLLQTAVKENPGSFFLLQSIADAKELYSKEELQYLLSLFDAKVLSSAAGKKINQYLRLRPDAGMAYPKLWLPGVADTTELLIDTTAKLNVLVFWASWCGPCIKEIPQLKQLQERFGKSGLRMTSVSIDTNKEAWQEAVLQHAMPWRQLLIDTDKIEELQQIFGFTTIPFLVMTDSEGKEVARFADYDEGNTKKYAEVIEQFLFSRKGAMRIVSH